MLALCTFFLKHILSCKNLINILTLSKSWCIHSLWPQLVLTNDSHKSTKPVENKYPLYSLLCKWPGKLKQRHFIFYNRHLLGRLPSSCHHVRCHVSKFKTQVPPTQNYSDYSNFTGCYYSFPSIAFLFFIFLLWDERLSTQTLQAVKQRF